MSSPPSTDNPLRLYSRLYILFISLSVSLALVVPGVETPQNAVGTDGTITIMAGDIIGDSGERIGGTYTDSKRGSEQNMAHLQNTHMIARTRMLNRATGRAGPTPFELCQVSKTT